MGATYRLSLGSLLLELPLRSSQRVFLLSRRVGTSTTGLLGGERGCECPRGEGGQRRLLLLVLAHSHIWRTREHDGRNGAVRNVERSSRRRHAHLGSCGLGRRSERPVHVCRGRSAGRVVSAPGRTRRRVCRWRLGGWQSLLRSWSRRTSARREGIALGLGTTGRRTILLRLLC